jgi:NTE family protein
MSPMPLRALALLLLAVAGCAAAPVVPPPAPIAPVAPPKPPEPPAMPRIALALGGGAARGFAHIGVIRVLEAEKIPIDLVVGTSVGSLIGALYAQKRDVFDLEWTAFALTQDDLLDTGVMNALVGMGLAKGERLEKFVESKVQVKTIEALQVPFAAVAADLNWGTKVVIDRGSVARAVHASSAVPGLFEPVSHLGKVLVDGGVVENIPIATARERGADLVVAVEIGEGVANSEIHNLVDVLLQSANIMFAINSEHSKHGADVLITPDVKGVGMLDFTQKKRCMQAGMEAARAAVPRIHAAIAAWRAAKVAAAAPVAAPAPAAPRVGP